VSAPSIADVRCKCSTCGAAYWLQTNARGQTLGGCSTECDRCLDRRIEASNLLGRLPNDTEMLWLAPRLSPVEPEYREGVPLFVWILLVVALAAFVVGFVC
jgi:hypothetical protein